MGVEALIATAIIGTVASTAVGVVGSMQQAAAAKSAANYQAQVAANNAAINQRNAELAQRNAEVARRNQDLAVQDARAAEAEGAQARALEGLKTRDTLGRQRVAAAASGLDVNSGSAVDLRAGAAGMGMLSDMNIRDTAARKAFNLRVKGLNYEDEAIAQEMSAANFGLQSDSNLTSAAASRAAGSAAGTAGVISAVGTLASGAAKTGSMLYDFQKAGGTPQPKPLTID